MKSIKIITIGKLKEAFNQEAVFEYVKRLKPYAKLEMLELKPESFNKSNKDKVKKIESEKILSVLDKIDKECIYLLHERGKNHTSKEFSKIIDNNPEIVFVIGGSLGFSEELLEKYKKISLSNMTFPHEVARILLIEQIYRGITIIKGKEYHY